jgi:very-short-patch-repair endonuclease
VHELLERRLPGYEPGDSYFSERVAQILEHVARLPGLVREHPVRIGSRTYHIDVAQPFVLLAHEADGWDAHRTRSAFYIDRARANDLVTAGWTVLRYTYEMSDEEIATIARDTYARLVAQRAHAS